MYEIWRTEILTVKFQGEYLPKNFIKMKELKKMKGVKVLSKATQRAIRGGLVACDNYHSCRPGTICHHTQEWYLNGVLMYTGYCVPYIEP